MGLSRDIFTMGLSRDLFTMGLSMDIFTMGLSRDSTGYIFLKYYYRIKQGFYFNYGNLVQAAFTKNITMGLSRDYTLITEIWYRLQAVFQAAFFSQIER